MKNDRLKPYVYKVEGASNFALYNIVTGEFYTFSTQGTISKLRKILLNEGLIFETEGIVPTKLLKLDLSQLEGKIYLRELQIRINGRGEDYCWSRIKSKKNKKFMQLSLLERLQECCKYIPLQKIRIEAEEYEKEKTEFILEKFNCNCVEINIENGLDKKRSESLKSRYEFIRIHFIQESRKKIKDQKISPFDFLYNQNFNPCLGHQLAIDTNGEIKCCLWSEEILGILESNDLKNMIINGTFDTYWRTTKNSIDCCKDCELRYTCDDCRVYALKQNGRMSAKPAYCDYDPYIGE